MRNNASVCIILFIILFQGVNYSFAINPSTTDPVSSDAQLDKNALEKQLGRKLKLKEKIGLWVAKKAKKKQERLKAKNEDKRKIHPLAWIASSLSISSFLVASILAIFDILAPFGFSIFLAVLIFSGFVLGIIAKKRIKKSPAKWKGKGLTLAAIIIGYVCISTFIFVLGLALG
jgi:hypothetical protein